MLSIDFDVSVLRWTFSFLFTCITIPRQSVFLCSLCRLFLILYRFIHSHWNSMTIYFFWKFLKQYKFWRRFIGAIPAWIPSNEWTMTEAAVSFYLIALTWKIHMESLFSKISSSGSTLLPMVDLSFRSQILAHLNYYPLDFNIVSSTLIRDSPQSIDNFDLLMNYYCFWIIRI